jgi:ribosomal protein L16 Arg81 hydroxylase
MDLHDLLTPVLPGNFFRDYWERFVCLVQRWGNNHYSDLCSIAELDSLIALTSDPSSPYKVRLVKTQQGSLNTRAVPFTSEGIINIYHVYRSCFEEGYTISIDRVDLKWKPVSELCRQLEETLQHPVAANLYFTPPQAQGFLPHYDTHDVFILQVEGAKVWRVYESPTELPLIQTNSSLPSEDLGTPKQTMKLEAGDLLYIPRGMIHDTFTENKPSLHITVGVHVFRWVDLISEALACLAEDDADFREALPPGFLNGDDEVLSDDREPGYLENRLRQMLYQVAAKANCEQAVRRLEDRILTNGQPIPDGHFLSLGTDIDLHTVVKRRAGMMCAVRLHDDRVTIHFPGNVISGPVAIEPALQFIRRTHRFKVNDLPNCLEPEDKLTLTRRLIREGLLSVDSDPANRPNND